MNEDQLFVTNAISRKDIAQELDVPADDPRLTDSFCQEYAKKLGEATDTYDEDAEMEAIDELNHEMRERLLRS